MALPSEQSKSGGFISISSSEDESSTPKRKRLLKSGGISVDEIADKGSENRAKRPRVSSSVGSIPDEKVSEEGEINENEAVSDDVEGRAREKSNTEQDEEKSAEKDAKREVGGTSSVFVPQDPPLFVQDSLSYRLPVFTHKREGSWLTRFKDWVHAFHASNLDLAATFTSTLVHAAYKQYIDCHSGLKQGKRRDAKNASATLEESGALATIVEKLKISEAPQQHGDLDKTENPSRPSTGSARGDQAVSDNAASEEIVATINSAYAVHDGDQQPQSSAAAGPVTTLQNNGSSDSAMAQKKGIPTGEDALMQQRRYFPSASDPANMCLLCGREGHIATECKDSSCKFCGGDDHWDFVCPTIPTRCDKCHQLGHSSGRCIEKLALTQEEGLVCFYCNSPDHIEDECTEVWRSYAPLAHVVKTVLYLPSSCAMCGSGQHYSGDCSQRQSGAINPTWSLRNRNLYIYPACTSAAIEESYSKVGKSTENRPSDMRIRGQSSRTHVQYESEDSDIEFLGQRATTRKAKVGQIRVSSNIQMPNERELPPLPPGPPPSLPRYPPPPGVQKDGFSAQLPPSSSLPSRPPPQNYQSVPPPSPLTSNSRGGFNGGRGGSRGRGGRGGRRGRGRGK